MPELLRELRDRLTRLGNLSFIVLYGSYSKGTYHKNSDVDIAVFVRDIPESKMLDFYRKAQRCTFGLSHDIQLMVFPDEVLSEPVGIIGEICQFGKEISKA